MQIVKEPIVGGQRVEFKLTPEIFGEGWIPLYEECLFVAWVVRDPRDGWIAWVRYETLEHPREPVGDRKPIRWYHEIGMLFLSDGGEVAPGVLIRETIDELKRRRSVWFTGPREDELARAGDEYRASRKP